MEGGQEMKITSRKAHAFIELRVDEIETIIFKSDQDEIGKVIYNLLEIVYDLASYTDKSIQEYVKEGEF